MTPDLSVTRSVGPLAGSLVRDAIAGCVAETGRCRLGLAGGSSPGPALRWLAAHLEPALAEVLTVTWVDERHHPAGVPADPADLPATSNLRGAWEAWLRDAAPRPTIVPLDGPGSLDEALHAVRPRYLAEIETLDVVLLGCGADGHVASLFPDHPALDADDAVLAVPDSPKPPLERLAVSLAQLQGVRTSVLVATGSAKAPVLARAWQGDPSLPLTHTRPHRGGWHWVLDPAAASTLGDDPR